MEKGDVLGLTNRTVLDMLSTHRPRVGEPGQGVLQLRSGGGQHGWTEVVQPAW